MSQARVSDSSSEYDSEELDSDKEVETCAKTNPMIILINPH